MDQLEGYFHAERDKEPQPEIHLRPDRRAKYDVVAKVLAAAQRNRMKKIGFVNMAEFSQISLAAHAKDDHEAGFVASCSCGCAGCGACCCRATAGAVPRTRGRQQHQSARLAKPLKAAQDAIKAKKIRRRRSAS